MVSRTQRIRYLYYLNLGSHHVLSEKYFAEIERYSASKRVNRNRNTTSRHSTYCHVAVAQHPSFYCP